MADRSEHALTLLKMDEPWKEACTEAALVSAGRGFYDLSSQAIYQGLSPNAKSFVDQYPSDGDFSGLDCFSDDLIELGVLVYEHNSEEQTYGVYIGIVGRKLVNEYFDRAI